MMWLIEEKTKPWVHNSYYYDFDQAKKESTTLSSAEVDMLRHVDVVTGITELMLTSIRKVRKC